MAQWNLSQKVTSASDLMHRESKHWLCFSDAVKLTYLWYYSNIANEFNTYFTNISTTLLDKIPSTDEGFHYYLKSFTPSNSIHFRPCTPIEIINTSNELQLKQNVGSDNISSYVKKFCIKFSPYLGWTCKLFYEPWYSSWWIKNSQSSSNI